MYFYLFGFPGGSDAKEPACNAGDPGSVPGLGRFPGEGNGYPFQYTCLKNPRTEEPGELQSIGSQELDMTVQLTLSLFQDNKNPLQSTYCSHTLTLVL